MVAQDHLPVSIKDTSDNDVLIEDSNLVQWLVNNDDFKKNKLDIAHDYESSLPPAEQVLCDPLHVTKSYKDFRKNFRLITTFKSVTLFEIFNFFEIGNDGGIVQPQVNYHGIESDIEPGIRKRLNEGLNEGKGTGWTFEFVLFVSSRKLDGDNMGEDYLRLHNMKNRTLIHDRVCQFTTYDSFPWEQLKSNAERYLSDEGNYIHKKPTMQNQIETGKFLPYKTNSSGLTYFWGVIDGLQRLSAIVNILNTDASNCIGELEVDVRINCPYTITASVGQQILRDVSCAYSKEIALNNKVISGPTLCSELSSVVMLTGEKFLPCNLNFIKQSTDILIELLTQMKLRFQDDALRLQLQSVIQDLLKGDNSDDSNTLMKWKNLLKKVDVKKRLCRMLYAKTGTKSREWLKEHLPYYYCFFLYCLFICYYQDNKFLVKFQGIKKVFNERSVAWVVTLSLQFIMTYLPHRIRQDNRTRVPCLISLMYIPFKDIITSIHDMLTKPNLLSISKSTLNLFLTNDLKSTAAETSGSEQSDIVESNELVIPFESKCFVDILLHKYLLLYLSIDSVRIACGFHSDQIKDDHFAVIQFPFLDKAIMRSDLNCVKQAQSNLNTLSIGHLFSSTLQDFCWFKRHGVMKKYPLTLKGFTHHILDLLADGTSVKLHPINALPLELFSHFDPPMETINIQSQVGRETANCVICAINNLFGKACVAISATKKQMHLLKQFGKTPPIYLNKLRLGELVETMAETGPFFSLKKGCDVNVIPQLLRDKLGCDIIDFNDTGDDSLHHAKIKHDKNLIGFLLVGNEVMGTMGHFVAMRKVSQGRDCTFMLLDSYEETFFGLFHFEAILSLRGSWRIFAVFETETWSNSDFMDLKHNKNDISRSTLPFVKFSSFHQVSGVVKYMSEHYTYLDDAPEIKLMRNDNLENTISVSGQKRKNGHGECTDDISKRSKTGDDSCCGKEINPDATGESHDDGNIENSSSLKGASRDDNSSPKTGSGDHDDDNDDEEDYDGRCSKGSSDGKSAGDSPMGDGRAVEDSSPKNGSDDNGDDDEEDDDEDYNDSPGKGSSDGESTGDCHDGENEDTSPMGDGRAIEDSSPINGSGDHGADNNGEEDDSQGKSGIDISSRKDENNKDDSDDDDDGDDNEDYGDGDYGDSCGKGSSDGESTGDCHDGENEDTSPMGDGRAIEDSSPKNGSGDHSEDKNDEEGSDDGDDDEEVDSQGQSGNDDGDDDEDQGDSRNKHDSDMNDGDCISNDANQRSQNGSPNQDKESFFLLLEELNQLFNNCISLRENTNKTVEIDMKKVSCENLKALLKAITVFPDISIILTKLPGMGRDMLNLLLASRLGKRPNVSLRLYSQGRFLGTSTETYSIQHVVDLQSFSRNENATVRYNFTDEKNIEKSIEINASELSLYYSDISTQRVDPSLMEFYDSFMPKAVKDMLPFHANDFSKYLNVANRTDYSGPNIYVATRDAYTGLHADNNFSVLAVHHNLIGTNRVILFRAPNDIASAKSLYEQILNASHQDQHNEAGIDIFHTYNEFPLQMNADTIKSLGGETFLLQENEVLLISCGRPHFFQKVGNNKSVHFSLAWDIIPFNLLHEGMFTTDLIRGLIFSAEACNMSREASEIETVIPDLSYTRSCLINYLLKAPPDIPKSLLCPLYMLTREQLEYKILGLDHKIVEFYEIFDTDVKSYHCDKCGMDLCNAYFSSKGDSLLRKTFCSQCINRVFSDTSFLVNNARIFSGIFKGPKHHPKVSPRSCLTLTYRYMTVEDLMSMCGIDSDREGAEFNVEYYRSLHKYVNAIIVVSKIDKKCC